MGVSDVTTAVQPLWTTLVPAGINFLTLLVLWLTLCAYHKQIGVLKSQVEVAQDDASTLRRSVDFQTNMSFALYLQSDEILSARRHVVVDLAKRPFTDWGGSASGADRLQASRVCSSYDLMGTAIKQGLIDGRFFLPHWGPSIVRCHEILAPYIADIREQEKAERRRPRWTSFDWLYGQARSQFEYGHNTEQPM